MSLSRKIRHAEQVGVGVHSIDLSVNPPTSDPLNYTPPPPPTLPQHMSLLQCMYPAPAPAPPPAQSMRALAGTLEHPHRMKAALDRGDYEEVLLVYSKVRALSGQTATAAAATHAAAAGSVEFMVGLSRPINTSLTHPLILSINTPYRTLTLPIPALPRPNPNPNPTLIPGDPCEGQGRGDYRLASVPRTEGAVRPGTRDGGCCRFCPTLGPGPGAGAGAGLEVVGG